MSRWTLRRRLAQTFIALAAMIAVLVVSAVVLSVRLYDAQSAVVERLFETYDAAADLDAALVAQEAGFRGYALTGRDEYLEPYRDGRRAAARTQPRLRRAEVDYPDLRASRRRVAAAVDAWRTEVARPGIAQVGVGDPLTAAELARGKASFDAVRSAVSDYRSLILDQRRTRVAALKRDVDLLFGTLAAGLLLLMLSAALTWVALRRWVTQPLERLGAEVDRVEGGDLSRRVSVVDAPAEIAMLAEQVDSMRARILHEYALAEQFAYVASHDLQEPLRKVANFCQLIEHRYKGQLDERGEQYIEFAVNGAKRMQQLINDLLAFSRVGRSGSGFAQVDLEKALDQAERQLEVTLTDAGAVLTHDPLPTVEGDQSLLVQLLQNLVGNGVKFRGPVPPRVHLSAMRSPEDPQLWEFSCTDNGIGIEEQYQDKIFVIFQRLHGRDAYAGTGIGLAMCKKIVEHHGGRLWLDTTPRESPGAVFRWTLPQSQPDEPVHAGGAPTIGTAATTGPTTTTSEERTTGDAAVRG